MLKSLGFFFLKEVSYAQQGCINDKYSNVAKYYYNNLK